MRKILWLTSGIFLLAVYSGYVNNAFSVDTELFQVFEVKLFEPLLKIPQNLAPMKSLIFILIFSISTYHWVIAQQIMKSAAARKEYFPLPDSAGGWRNLTDAKKINTIK